MTREQLMVRIELVRAALAIRAGDMTNDPVTDEVLVRYAALRERVRALEVDADQDIAVSFELTEASCAMLWLAIAVAIDPDARAMLTKITGRSQLSVDVLRGVVCGSDIAGAIRETSQASPLFRFELLERTDTGSETVHESRRTYCASPRVLAWLAGDRSLDSRVTSAVSVSSAVPSVAECVFDTSGLAAARQAVAGDGAVVVACGARGVGRRTLLGAAARENGIETLEIDARQLAKDIGAFKKQLKLVARECLLLDRAPLICNIDMLADDRDNTRVDLVGSELVNELRGPVFVTCGVNRPAMRWNRPTIVIDVRPPTSAQRAQLWLRELGQGSAEDADYLATQYPLAPALIHHAAAAAKARAAGRKIEPEDIYAGVRAVLDDRLGQFAKRIDVTQTWDDLVLPQDQQDAITYLIARIRQRRTVYEQWGFAAKVGKGLGVSALFSGPPGTGKTMVAALIAKELGLELYQVDMAKLVSKWIGETERNLAELFDAAEAGHAILLFDEADSLFGKRTDVKSSNDRYANLETNYMLQRLESFTGICLLTSNHESNIDPAFQRRLSLHVRFELPDAAEREALWRAMMPTAAPVESNLDVASLAKRFAMSGGYIRNAALRAAFMAADEGSPITSGHLEQAARLEYEGMGKIAA